MKESRDPASPAWQPDPAAVADANLTTFMAARDVSSFRDLHRWSVESRAEFWDAVSRQLGIVWRTPYRAALGPGSTPEQPRWFEGGALNIVESCLRAPTDRTAVMEGDAAGGLRKTTYGDLADLVGRCAAGLRRAGVGEREPVAIAMPMTLEAVVAYLAIVAIGAVVVSIADSFAAPEIELRLRITGARVAVTQDVIRRSGKVLPMYRKVLDAGVERAIVVQTSPESTLRAEDLGWRDLVSSEAPLECAPQPPDASSNVLFSSGTTGDPKAIPWTHITPIKAAMDGYFHHDVHPTDVVAWPTNLGWMMGPWLIYATLVNGATMALYGDAPTTAGFARFVEQSGVTVLGVVPSLVAGWRASDALRGVDWSAVRVLSSTGEASTPDDMRWLMETAGAPMIEYCGGTEVGGGYITGTVLQPAIPSAFSTPALGIDIRILDDHGSPAEEGEVFLVPPSVGLSTRLINRDHHEVYYAGTPDTGEVLRRHGDHMRRLPGGYFRALGRVDDTMNLGGIKVSSAEIERVLAGVPGIDEVAAVAYDPPDGGPSKLVVFATTGAGDGRPPDLTEVTTQFQARIRDHLNPLFKIDRVELVPKLPRTASAKVMRRELRRSLGSG